MRILVYGAGVQGCELAHRLLQNKKNVVTMLARGEWKERLDQRGLVIRHWAQCRTTVDRVATIDTLAPDDCYDLVFVTMQAGQLPDVLPSFWSSVEKQRANTSSSWATTPTPWRSCRPCSARRIRSPSASRAAAATGMSIRSSAPTSVWI